MIEYKFNEQYNIIILKRKDGIYEYYLEKVNYGSLAYMFGVENKIEPSEFEKDYILGFIKDCEEKEFWGVC